MVSEFLFFLGDNVLLLVILHTVLVETLMCLVSTEIIKVVN
jgi:hypothetical protein